MLQELLNGKEIKINRKNIDIEKIPKMISETIEKISIEIEEFISENENRANEFINFIDNQIRIEIEEDNIIFYKKGN